MSNEQNETASISLSQLKELLFPKESFDEKLKTFRSDRITAIKTSDLPVDLPSKAKVVLHIVPSNAFDKGTKIDLNIVHKEETLINPISIQFDSKRFNFDGYLTSGGIQDNKTDTYFQIYRSGIIEAVDTKLTDKDAKGIRVIFFEQQIIQALEKYTELLGKLDIKPPYIVLLSVLGVKGYTVGVASDGSKPIDKDDLILPEFQITTAQYKASEILKPSFDIIWNASGRSRSFNYDQFTGEWRSNS